MALVDFGGRVFATRCPNWQKECDGTYVSGWVLRERLGEWVSDVGGQGGIAWKKWSLLCPFVQHLLLHLHKSFCWYHHIPSISIQLDPTVYPFDRSDLLLSFSKKGSTVPRFQGILQMIPIFESFLAKDLVKDKVANDRPVWKMRGGERWLYLTTAAWWHGKRERNRVA